MKIGVALLIFQNALFPSFLTAKIDSSVQSAKVQFDGPSEITSPHGYAQLSWTGLDENLSYQGFIFELEKSNDKDFNNSSRLYLGPDYSTFISGLNNGQYYFRIRIVNESSKTNGPWANPLVLTVEHQSLNFALMLFILGFVVFSATALVIIFGHRMKQSEQT